MLKVFISMLTAVGVRSQGLSPSKPTERVGQMLSTPGDRERVCDEWYRAAHAKAEFRVLSIVFNGRMGL